MVLCIVAGWMRGWIVAGFLVAFSILMLWAGLFLGMELGYRAWQAMPDPPDEAFADIAPVGALVFGWVPSGMFCGFVFAIVRIMSLKMRSPVEPNSASLIEGVREPRDGAMEAHTAADPNNPYSTG